MFGEEYWRGIERDNQKFMSRLDSLHFIDDEHRQSFVALLEKTRKAWNPEYAAAFYLLTIDNEMRKKSKKYILKDGIDFLAMQENEDFSSSYRRLVRIAFDLFNYGRADDDRVAITDVACMSYGFYLCTLEAFRLRRGVLDGGFLA